MIRVLTSPVPLRDLQLIAAESFGDFVKAVVDIRLACLAVGGELHADAEAELLEQGSRQSDLWGINLYPGLEGDAMVEFDSIINIRPGQGNRSRSIEDPALRSAILALVHTLILK